jgi:hypothetical protein
MNNMKWIAQLTLFLLSALSTSATLAISNLDLKHNQIAAVIPQLLPNSGIGELTDPLTKTNSSILSELGAINTPLRHNKIEIETLAPLNFTDFALYGVDLNTTYSLDDLFNTVFKSNGLTTNAFYELLFTGNIDSQMGGSHDVTVNAVPLPSAIWLLGTAIVGFSAFSGRRSL